MARKIFITGADGFIGSHLTEHLVEQGFEVKALCLYNSFGHKGWLDYAPKQVKENVEFVLGDIRDYGQMEESIKGVDYVLHLASLIAIPYSYHAPQSYIDTNITGTHNILRAALKNSVKQVVHTSTSEVYGTAQYVPIDEKHPLVGQSPYSASKIGADQIADSYYRSFELPVSTVRPFNTYGPRQSARAVIPTIISQLLNGADKLKLGNLTATRDFNFVKDTARGIASFIDNEKSFGEVINLGTGTEISIEDLAKSIGEVVGQEFEFEIEQERIRPEKSEVERLCADNKKALELLSWKPEHAGLDGLKKGLAETVEWFKANANDSFYNPDKYTI